MSEQEKMALNSMLSEHIKSKTDEQKKQFVEVLETLAAENDILMVARLLQHYIEEYKR